MTDKLLKTVGLFVVLGIAIMVIIGLVGQMTPNHTALADGQNKVTQTGKAEPCKPPAKKVRRKTRSGTVTVQCIKVEVTVKQEPAVAAPVATPTPAPVVAMQQQQQQQTMPDIIIHNHIPPAPVAPAAPVDNDEVMRQREPVARYDYNRDEEYFRRRVQRDRQEYIPEPECRNCKKGSSTLRKVGAVLAGTGTGAGVGYLRNRCPRGAIDGALSGGAGSAVAVLIAK